MIFLKNYTSIKGYLERFSILKIGKLHIRIHHIKQADKTDFYHTHPFSYISIILKGSYDEEIFRKNKFKHVHNSFGHFILRHHSAHHRITACAQSKTLFIAWNVNKKFDLKTKDELLGNIEKNIKVEFYLRNIQGKKKICKLENNKWFIGHDDMEGAKNEKRLSIFQVNENGIDVIKKL